MPRVLILAKRLAHLKRCRMAVVPDQSTSVKPEKNRTAGPAVRRNVSFSGGFYRSVAQRNRRTVCAKHIELSGLLRDFGDHLNARGAGADYRDLFTREDRSSPASGW